MLTGPETRTLADLVARAVVAGQLPAVNAPPLAVPGLDPDPIRAAAQLVDEVVVGTRERLAELLRRLPESGERGALEAAFELRTGPLVLDSRPFPWGHPVGQELYDALCRATTATADIEGPVKSVPGFDWQRVDLDGSIRAVWRSVLDEVAAARCVLALVDRVLASDQSTLIRHDLRRLRLVRHAAGPAPGQGRWRSVPPQEGSIEAFAGVAYWWEPALPDDPAPLRAPPEVERLVVILLDTAAAPSRVLFASLFAELARLGVQAVLLDAWLTLGPDAPGTAELRAAIDALHAAGASVHALCPPEGPGASDLPTGRGEGSGRLDELVDGSRGAEGVVPITWPSCKLSMEGERRTLGFTAFELLGKRWPELAGSLAYLPEPLSLPPVPKDRSIWPFPVLPASQYIGGPSTTLEVCGIELSARPISLAGAVVIVGNGMVADDSIQLPTRDGTPVCVAGAEAHAWVAIAAFLRGP